jgi:hypothetical protein
MKKRVKTSNSMAEKKDKKPVELVSFYGGRAVIEKKPWGDHFRFTVQLDGGDKRSGIVSATGVTKFLDKSQALLPWAVGLVGSHVTSTFEARKGVTFSKEEIYLVVGEAVLKPDEAKVAGGKTGDAIHEYAHTFAEACIAGTTLPKVPKLDHMPEEERQKSLNGINAFLDFYNSHDVEFLGMEQLVYYNSLLAGDTACGEDVVEYLGIMDLLARVDGNVGVWDYKTGKRVYTDQRYQLSGYRKAWNSNPDNQKLFCVESGVLSFSKDTGDLTICRVSNEESEKDFKAFRGLHAVALREKELEAERNNSKKNESK